VLIEPELKPLMTAIILFAVIVSVYVLISFPAPMINQDTINQPIGEISGSRIVGQSFMANGNGLTRIDIKMATYARTNTKDVTFYLREANSTEDLARVKINAQQIKDNSFHHFEFDPIPDSNGKSYILSIQSPESKPGNSITVWYSTNDVYPNGTALVNSTPIEGDLSFRVYYDIPRLDILSFSFRKFTTDIAFAVTYTILVGVIVLGIVWLYVKHAMKKNSN
jgi:hypothetical protein